MLGLIMYIHTFTASERARKTSMNIIFSAANAIKRVKARSLANKPEAHTPA